MVIVLVPLAPWATVSDAGEAAMLKFGDAVALIVKAIVVVAVRLPEDPVMVTVDVPVVAVTARGERQHAGSRGDSYRTSP